MTATKERVNYARVKKELNPYWEAQIGKAYFTPKVIYKNEKGQFVTKVFKSELSKGDFHCEFINTDETTFHKDRTLYKLIPRADFQKVYEVAASSDDLFIVPVSDFQVVDTQSSAYLFGEPRSTSKSSTKEVDSIGGAVDNVLLQITVRDLFAIIHKTPISKNEEINNLIRKYI